MNALQQMRMSSPLINRPHLSAAPPLAGLVALGSPGAVGSLKVRSRHVGVATAQATLASQQSVHLALLLVAQLATSLLQQGPSETARLQWENNTFAPARLSRAAHLPPCAQPCGTCSRPLPAGRASSGRTWSPADASQQHFSSRAATLAHIRSTATRQAPPLAGMLEPAPHAQPSHKWAAGVMTPGSSSDEQAAGLTQSRLEHRHLDSQQLRSASAGSQLVACSSSTSHRAT